MLKKEEKFRDFTIVLILAVFVYIFASVIDLYELVTRFVEKHEKWNVDEFIVVFIVLGFIFMSFYFRKFKQLQREITERKKTAKTLRENQKRLFLATKIAQLGLWDLNLVNGDLFWSDETYRHYGYKPQEFVPSYEKFASIVHPDDLGFVQERVDAAINNNAEYNIDFRFIRSDGSIGYLYTQGMVISRDETGKALRFIGTQIDITERKKAEEKLKTRTEELEKINKAFVSRELKMIELKKEIEEIRKMQKT